MKINTFLLPVFLILAACGRGENQDQTTEQSTLLGTDDSCSNFTRPADGHYYHCASYPMHDTKGQSTGFRSTLFQISSAFTPEQQKKIARALDIAMWHVGEHFIHRYVEKQASSDFMNCVARKNPGELIPVDAPAAIRGKNATFYAEYAMGGITILQNFHDFRKVPAKISVLNVPLPTLAQTPVGKDYSAAGASQNMDIQINIQAFIQGVNGQTWSDRGVAGAIFHEWLHRIGFQHLAGQGANVFINVAGACVEFENR
ncbi:MAG TPA: hypothetical protein VE954_11250 [Oligoflexus sp.]|uniref:hypothetical protein n=1 Tax=Oligoflexus sp. TaxID=1971216 RepID=UPI002D5440A3|nr:hypothetical protein [Oligoflexus sp.]HYX33681.1 hypothetical protein [Oligoflexus sp.]